MSQVGTRDQIGGKLPQSRSLALVAVGSNAPFGEVDPTEVIQTALYSLSEKFGVIRAQSAFYRSPAFPVGSGPDFVNAAFSIETDASPAELINSLHVVEAAFGRVRRQRWAPRTLDLDLIAYENQVLPDERTLVHWLKMPLHLQQETAPDALILPHPRLQDRAFVLVPLADIAPDWTHPVLQRTVVQMLEALPKTAIDEVQRL